MSGVNDASADRACLGCLFNNVADFSRCESSGSEARDPATFSGDSEIGLLSRYPILKQDILSLDAYFQPGAVLYAEIDLPTLGPVHAFCSPSCAREPVHHGSVAPV